ncbi:TonB-dependent receptor plug domain-containing protein [Vibrio sp. SCSIO 43137]|uniref:TonB-dependent receptor plug domain-containing protein n=1 Tax=Vibrio sp. SCSIO 43137 TaxID=3021011 RepID=UPI002307F721|nr:TonB-dependent receptor [Vibrio sp. SCSIO 43137]WCE28717.1 TonB-dependent receptor plug domain-containing protein [Vibrio sp. SCSIO 43137]
MKHLVGLVYLLPMSVLASAAMQDLTALSIEELMQIEVTSVSKKREKLSQAAAAVYVVTRNDIRRSGATSIPEALRLVPGVDVAQIDPNKWAIGIRGFNGRLENKLLVMIDGRSVYTPTFSGVYWENLDYVMEDIERIEVIRGPGATLWGTNAVNGVINIITREVSETLGGYASAGAGNELQGLLSVRQGGKVSDSSQLRVYAKGRSLDKGKGIDGLTQNNGGDSVTSGFRLDWQGDDGVSGVINGELFKHHLQQEHSATVFQAPYGIRKVDGDVNIDGGNISGRWSKFFSLDSEFSVNVRYDYYDRKELKYGDKRDTADLDFKHQYMFSAENELIWGGGYRYSRNKITDGLLGSVKEKNQNTDIWNLFAQNKLSFPQKDTTLTFGVKFEGNSYSDVEIQPGLRASWSPDDELTVWSALSRAKRIPSRGETDIRFDLLTLPPGNGNPLPMLVRIEGDQDFAAEKVDAFEWGLRWMATDDLSVDLAYYYNDYSNLRSYVMQGTTMETINGTLFSVAPLKLDNNIHGYGQGVELLTTWQATEMSRYRISYTYIQVDLKDSQYNDFSDDMVGLITGRAPEHQASLWASYDIQPDKQLDIRLFYVDERPWNLHQPGGVKRRYNADVRYGWQVNRNLELSVSGRNLLHTSQQEFIAEIWPSSSKIERSFLIKADIHW